MRCVLWLPPGQPIRESPSGTCSKQRRRVTTPRSLSSISGTVLFWPTACSQSVQLSQPSTWCERGQKGSSFLWGLPVRSFSVAVVVPPLSLEFEEGPPVGLYWPSGAGRGGGGFRWAALHGSRGRSRAGNPLRFLAPCCPAKHLGGCCCTTRCMVSQRIELTTVPRTVSEVRRVCMPTGLRPSTTFCEGHAVPVSSG
jgi:hypothetical protein